MERADEFGSEPERSGWRHLKHRVAARREQGRRQVNLPPEVGSVAAPERLHAALRDEIAPALRTLGLKGSGRALRLPSETHLLAIGLQSSAYNTSSEARFTVNLAAARRSTWTQVQPLGRTEDRFFNPNLHQPAGSTTRLVSSSTA